MAQKYELVSDADIRLAQQALTNKLLPEIQVILENAQAKHDLMRKEEEDMALKVMFIPEKSHSCINFNNISSIRLCTKRKGSKSSGKSYKAPKMACKTHLSPPIASPPRKMYIRNSTNNTAYTLLLLSCSYHALISNDQ